MVQPVPFTCTLGQAAIHGADSNFSNISSFLTENARKFPDLPAVGFPIPPADQNGDWHHRIISFANVLKGTCATAKAISESVILSDRETVALLCPSTIEFLFTWLGLIRLGHPVLLIAPQCSPSGIADLCHQCEVHHLFCDEKYRDLGQEASESFTKDDHKFEIHALPFSQGGDSYEPAHGTECAPIPASRVDKHEVAYLHHTSGTSSGTPKPIPQTHQAGVGVDTRLDDSSHATFTTTPLYHGGIADLFRAWASNALIWLFPGKDLPITATNVVKCLEVAAQADTPPAKYFSSVPYVLEMMAADDKGLDLLQNMEIVGVGGAALPTEVGDRLVQQGVNLVSRFGSAECGFLMSSHRDFAKDQDWQYLRTQEGEKWLQFEPRDDNLYELVILPGWPHMAKKNREDGSFATSDLFSPHPNIKNAWRYDSRADSQITLITGKKFDPAPLESAIAAKSKLLKDVLVFGEGKPYPGALLFRSQGRKDLAQENILAEIAADVEKLNKEGQKHTHIPRSALTVMPYNDSPLEKSSKGTVLRKKAEQRYSQEIEATYDNASAGFTDVQDTDVESSILDFIVSITDSSDTAGKPRKLEPETDLFAYGIDSVLCVQIRKAVSKLLPESSPALPLTVVQDTGSIRKLSELVIDTRHGRSGQSRSFEDVTKEMEDFVEQYSRLDEEYSPPAGSLPPTPPRSPRHSDQGKTVLLTGPTGSLGSHLLEQLLSCPEVRHIHLLVRGATAQAAEERVRKALFSKKLPIAADFDTKVSIHRYSLTQPFLGLSAEVYDQLVLEVELIYHLAWAVDFTLPVHGFKQHFTGLKALLELSQRHARSTEPPCEPSKVVFCSSTASVASYQKLHPESPIPELIVNDPECSGGIGYSQSKWVAEAICNKAVKDYPTLKNAVNIVRVGQLSGDTINGVWNKSEAYPLMLSSAKMTGCLPDLKNESVAWIPVDLAAKAFLELGTTSTVDKVQQHTRVLHLLSQDHTTSWSMLLEWISKEANFKVVKPSEWLHLLESLSAKQSDHSSLKLLEFWKVAYGGGNTAEEQGRNEDHVSYDVDASIQAMPALRELRPVDADYAMKLWRWIDGNV